MVAGIVSDRLGRRPAIFWGSIIGLIGVILQSVEQNVAMFVVARIILGFGGGCLPRQSASPTLAGRCTWSTRHGTLLSSFLS